MKKNSAVKNLLAVILAFSFIFPGLAPAQTATKAKSPARKAAEAITAKQMSDYLYFIASDEMEGRDTPSRGLDTTAKFIGMNLSRWGFKPAGDDGTFYQKIALLRELPDTQNSSLTVGGEDFKYGDDYFRLSGSSQTPISAPLVYGGDGWLVKSKNLDPLQNVDAAGKIVVLYSDGLPTRTFATAIPKGVMLNELTAETRGKEWLDPLSYAKEKGAVGVIILASDAAQKDWERLSKSSVTSRLFVEKFRSEVSLPTVFLSRKTSDALFTDADKAPYRTGGAPIVFDSSKTVRFNAAVKPERVFTQNVVALWEGSDAKLKTEMVAIGAHYDHIGVSQNSTNADKINNGADDDGSGTTAVLSIAEALAKSPKRPKRSVLFVWHCGEEKGLWGSQYFTSYPTIDLKNVVAQLNIDMIGRSKNPANIIPCDKPGKPCNDTLSAADEIYVIGSEMLSSKLGAAVKSVNDAYLKLNYNFKYDDPKDPNRFYYRSDHFNYAKFGIPITFWFDGVHEDYHQPGDEPQKIDYNKMQSVARTIFLTLWDVADLKERPAVDKQLSADRMAR